METLTIAIPTYNRAIVLNQNLKLILSNNNLQFQVVVCDNNSSDDTKIVCEKYKKDYLNFNYFKNSKNIGYDANVIRCLECSTSKYVWFLSDDDFIDDLLIEYIINYLKVNSPIGVLINAIVKNLNTGKVLINSLGYIDYNTVETCNDLFFEKTVQWSTLISSIIIKRDEVDLLKASSYIGTCFVQLSIFWHTCANKDVHILGSKKVLKNDSEKQNFNLSNDEIWFRTWIKVISSFKDTYSTSACKNAATSLYDSSKFNTSGVIIHVLISRANSKISTKDYSFIVENLNLSFIKRILIFIILLSNEKILSFSFKLMKSIKKYK